MKHILRLILRAIRIYTPFICTFVALINGVLLDKYGYEKVPDGFLFLSSSMAGNSIIVVLYFFSASMKMCIWYKLNLFFLLLNQIAGLFYYYNYVDFDRYTYLTILFSMAGVGCFLLFKMLYKVTDTFMCTGRHSGKS